MFYTEKERKINAVKTDVLIVGSGPAGIGAAISASRPVSYTHLLGTRKSEMQSV